ncbi:hypothetical protein R3I93_013203 [Phoxinus phoxinus]|uniref:Cysteine dioxygenase n=1 Tax=Phoxinus phoxinus TaxID=58324 RepID=A0AAN9CPA3_9TELE
MEKPVTKPETLDDLIKTLRKKFEKAPVNVDDLMKTMEAYKSKEEEWEKFINFYTSGYTRNRVYEEKGKFELLVLCWSANYKSDIHTHPGLHCFMKLLQGKLEEKRFECRGPSKPKSLDPSHPAGMVQTSQNVLKENQCTYITDSIGLHRVENLSEMKGAVSLHLYCPLSQACQTLTSAKDTAAP